MTDIFFNYFAAAAILVMLSALWYGWRRATKIPHDPSLPGPYDDGFRLGDEDGYYDGVRGQPYRPDLGGYNDGTQFALGYFEGYENGYQHGKEEREMSE